MGRCRRPSVAGMAGVRGALDTLTAGAGGGVEGGDVAWAGGSSWALVAVVPLALAGELIATDVLEVTVNPLGATCALGAWGATGVDVAARRRLALVGAGEATVGGWLAWADARDERRTVRPEVDAGEAAAVDARLVIRETMVLRGVGAYCGC